MQRLLPSSERDQLQRQSQMAGISQMQAQWMKTWEVLKSLMRTAILKADFSCPSSRMPA